MAGRFQAARTETPQQVPAGAAGQAIDQAAHQAAAEAADIERLRARIDKLAKPCGCKSGAALTLLALVGWPAGVVVAGIPHALPGALAVLAGYPLVVLAAAIVGKVAGIVVGRERRRWYRRRLTDLMSAAPPLVGTRSA